MDMLQNTKKMTFFDPIIEKGHIEFNNLFVNAYKQKSILRERKVRSRNYFLYHLKSLINHYYFIKASKKKDVFLVFNNFSLFLLTYLFKEIKASFIVHNNLDFAFKNNIQRKLYKRIMENVKLIYLEERLVKEAEKIGKHKQTEIRQHPIIKIPINEKVNEQFVFVSSRNLTEDQLLSVCEIEKDKQVICNREINGKFPKNLKMGFIKDFDRMLSTTCRVYIIGDYRYRVSGILYKALSNNQIEIVLSDKKYYDEMMKLKEKKVIENNILLNTMLK